MLCFIYRKNDVFISDIEEALQKLLVGGGGGGGGGSRLLKYVSKICGLNFEIVAVTRTMYQIFLV